MKRKVLGVMGVLLLLGLTFTAGRLYDSGHGESTSETRRILYYVDPMDPAHVSDKPGKAPCGMDMEPVYADDAVTDKMVGEAPGSVKINAEKQQVIGVKTAITENVSEKKIIRTTGKIVPDEKRVYRLIAGSDGWIRETYNSETGMLVKKNQRLASFYSPQFWSAQVSYISLYGSKDDHYIQPVGKRALAPSQQASISHQTYLDALEGLGMSEQQIQELAETKKMTDRVYIVSPANGFILARDVSPGQRFEKGAEWYRIADLSRVWVVADVFQNEAEWVKPGARARIILRQLNKEYQAVVSKVLPQFDAVSRTLKVRLEIDNPRFVLKPDMFVDVEFSADLPQGLSIPSDAVLDSGLRKIVYVDRGEGYFEPRQIETGWRTADRVQITRGLMAGEQIVVSGNFLIDSESKMKMAAAGTLKKNTAQRFIDPVCGMNVIPSESKRAGLFLEHDEQALYFCTKECKEKFAKDPRRYGVATDNKTVRMVPFPGTPESEKTMAKDVKPRSAPEHQKQLMSGQLTGNLPINSGVARP